MCTTAVQMAAVAIINSHSINVAVSFETATNTVYISSHFTYVFFLCNLQMWHEFLYVISNVGMVMCLSIMVSYNCFVWMSVCMRAHMCMYVFAHEAIDKLNKFCTQASTLSYGYYS